MKISLEMEPHELGELMRTFGIGSQVLEPARHVVSQQIQIPPAAELRAWAKANKLPVSAKGVVPRDVKAMWVEANYG